MVYKLFQTPSPNLQLKKRYGSNKVQGLVKVTKVNL